MTTGGKVGLAAVAALAVVTAAALADSQAPRPTRVRVSVVNADLAAIVQRVGGSDVEVNVLFKGCVLRPNLSVEEGALNGLLSAEAVVWSGLFHESAAIYQAVEALGPEKRATLRRPTWIDVSHGVARVKVPTSSCEGFVAIQFMHGDPFFWLNPDNGAVMARNIARGLAELRPARAAAYAANAESFADELARHRARWRRQLAPLAGVKIFVTQCGWANLARLGPVFLSCRSEPGVLARPEVLAEQIAAQEIPIVVVDPHTPPEYGEVFRTKTKARVVTIPSSIGELPGAREYHALFDNLVLRLLEAAGRGVAAAPTGGSHE